MPSSTKYPIGEQDFKSLRLMDCIYVDKTRFIERLITSGGKYYFLARPRRFGKSLFLSTLLYFFEGKRELYRGLYIDSMEWDWKPYPVLHLDLNVEKYAETGVIDLVLDNLFKNWEKLYGVTDISANLSARLGNIIKAACEKTGQQVVILVDEYDKPLIGNLNDIEKFDYFRSKLAAIYSNFKSSAQYIRFVFITGVSRFSKLSIFSDLNNINDITFDNDYADICGITATELNKYFTAGIGNFAHQEKVSFDKACRLLQKNYDGYRFAKEGSEIYNPWSLLNCLSKREIGNYWNETGIPTVVAQLLSRINVDLSNFFDSYCSEEELKGLDLLNPKPLALLYQTGYLTIKNYNRKVRRYRLGIPNNEVKSGLYDVLLPYYVNSRKYSPKEVINEIVISFILGNPEKAMKAMQAYFAGIDFKMKMEDENNFHNAFYLLLDIIGLETTAESHTSDGSIDILVKTEDYIYVIELKYDHSASEALRQIEEKKYDLQFQTDSREVFRIGVAFSSKTRCIEGWEISRMSKQY